MNVNQVLVEFIGTFVFLSVVLSSGQAIPIALALATAIYFGGKTSGGHFNPAVSTMFLLKGSMNNKQFLGHVVGQLLGAVAALHFNNTVLA